MAGCSLLMAGSTTNTTMLTDFFTRALIAGIGVAAVTGPLGCFIVWRRLAYFGDTLAHAALLGVALALMLEINVMLAVFVMSAAISMALLALQRSGTLSSDSLLGLLSHAALATGLVALAFMTWVRFDLMGLLFGDILAVSPHDILIIYVGGASVLVALAFIWRPLFAATVNAELAEAEDMQPTKANLIFMLLMSVVIAISMKIVGVLLITALLIIPPATARRLSSSPEQMAIVASFVGILAVIGGLCGSMTWDTPSGPSIVMAAVLMFLFSLTPVVDHIVLRMRRDGQGDVG